MIIVCQSCDRTVVYAAFSKVKSSIGYMCIYLRVSIGAYIGE
jgi:hypothetical protein